MGCGVDVAVAGLQRAGDDLLGLLGRDLEHAKPELGDRQRFKTGSC
jgi:hypothetical protein